MINRINHIGIAVNNIEDMAKLYAGVLGLEAGEMEVVAEQKAKVVTIPVGESRIELLASTDPEGPIARHIEKRGEGIHHLALEVSDIQGVLDRLKKKGVTLIDDKPRAGAGGSKMAFLHPKGMKALIELVEPAETG